MLKILFIFIWATSFFYLMLILFLALLQKKLIFSPSRNMVAKPSDLGLDFDDINFINRDGISLNGWFVPAKNAEFTVLFCHGNGGNISHRLDTISLFNKLPANFFLFDYQSYGRSSGVASENGLYEDVDAAWCYLTETRKIEPENIIIIGRSLGGAVAAHAAEKYSPGGLILESTFTSLPEIAKKRMPFLAVSWLINYKFTTLESLIKVKCPVLVIASPDDNIVPFSFSQKLFAGASEPKTFVQLTGDHDDCYFLCRAKYVLAVTNFFGTCFGNSSEW